MSSFPPSYRATNSVRRKPRSLSATDTEWQRIRERAAAAGLSVSQFLVERALEPVIDFSKVVGPQPPWLRRAARDCIALALLQELRFDEKNRGEEWQEVIAQADGLVASQEQWQ